jgi:hypothetical protein
MWIACRFALVVTIGLSVGSIASAQVVVPPGKQPTPPRTPPLYPGLKENPFDQVPPVLPTPPRVPPVKEPPPVVKPPPVVTPPPVVVVPPPVVVNPYPPADPPRTDSDSDPTKRDSTYSTETPPPDKPLAATGYASHESLLRGLFDVNPHDVRPRAGDVISVRTKMREKEVQTLIQSVNGNSRLYQNAEKLTLRLQEIGVLRAGDRVVGYAAGKIYAVVGSGR